MTLIKLLPAVSQLSASARIKMFGVITEIPTYIASNELFKNYVPIHLSAIWDDSQAKR
jgi:hypothetical protein